MADQNQNDRDSAIGDENQSSQTKKDQGREAGSNRSQEQDDVAEDRNLSGSSTWLTLPDQPSGDDQSNDSDDSRGHSNR
jgi:hypothetical protein